ncbi:MAG: TonB family protein [Janthinobacterium lividum]
MKLKTHFPLFAATLTTVSVFCAPDLLCAGVSGQNAAGSQSVSGTTQHGPEASGQTNPAGGVTDVDILSDTHGVDFNPYLHGILNKIYGQWVGLLPEEAHKPTLAKGETDVRFTISPDGNIASMHLDANTHDDQLNHAAWGAISGAQQFPPLPAAFTGPNLELRIHFRVNLMPSTHDGTPPGELHPGV